MDIFSKRGLFPGFTIFTGMVGFALRCWQFAATDDRGLLPANHIAGTVSLVLLALTLAVCFLGVWKAARNVHYREAFPPSELAAVGTAVGAIGVGWTAFSLDCTGILRVVVLLFGILGALALLLSAYCRLKGLRPNCLLHGTVAVFLMFRTLACCKAWGAEPQIQLFFFHLLASLFLLIACYYRAELDIRPGDCRRYVFFSQAALFCCCMCLPTEDWLFYLSAGIWLATDFCVLPTGKED